MAAATLITAEQFAKMQPVDGEDFELMFTVGSGAAVSLLDAWKSRFPGLGLSCIGKITEGGILMLRDKEQCRPLTAHGYMHFA